MKRIVFFLFVFFFMINARFLVPLQFPQKDNNSAWMNCPINVSDLIVLLIGN